MYLFIYFKLSVNIQVKLTNKQISKKYCSFIVLTRTRQVSQCRPWFVDYLGLVLIQSVFNEVADECT